jgi:hypothetical protein
MVLSQIWPYSTDWHCSFYTYFVVISPDGVISWSKHAEWNNKNISLFDSNPSIFITTLKFKLKLQFEIWGFRDRN